MEKKHSSRVMNYRARSHDDHFSKRVGISLPEIGQLVELKLWKKSHDLTLVFM